MEKPKENINFFDKMNALQNDSDKRTYKAHDIIKMLDIGRSSAYELIRWDISTL